MPDAFVTHKVLQELGEAMLHRIEQLDQRATKVDRRLAVEAMARDILRDRDGRMPSREELDAAVERHTRGFSVVHPLVLDEASGPWTLVRPDGPEVALVPQ